MGTGFVAYNYIIYSQKNNCMNRTLLLLMTLINKSFKNINLIFYVFCTAHYVHNSAFFIEADIDIVSTSLWMFMLPYCFILQVKANKSGEQAREKVKYSLLIFNAIMFTIAFMPFINNLIKDLNLHFTLLKLILNFLQSLLILLCIQIAGHLEE